jgi:hypothetical protein
MSSLPTTGKRGLGTGQPPGVPAVRRHADLAVARDGPPVGIATRIASRQAQQEPAAAVVDTSSTASRADRSSAVLCCVLPQEPLAWSLGGPPHDVPPHVIGKVLAEWGRASRWDVAAG